MKRFPTALLFLLVAPGGCGGGVPEVSREPSAAPALGFEPARVIGRAGTGSGEFERPTGLALDHEGALYVVDSGNDRLEKFDRAGVFLLEFGTFGSKAGQLIEPLDACADYGFSIVVSDSRNRRWQTFDLDGNVLGINIARAGRVESWALPADVIDGVLKELKDGKHQFPKDEKKDDKK